MDFLSIACTDMQCLKTWSHMFFMIVVFPIVKNLGTNCIITAERSVFGEKGSGRRLKTLQAAGWVCSSASSPVWTGAWWEQLTWYLAPYYVWMDLSVMITLQWAQGGNLKTHSTVSFSSIMEIEAKDFIVNIRAHLSERLTENTSWRSRRGGLMKERAVKKNEGKAVGAVLQ